MKIDVLILYEHVARELESALLLEKFLKKYGLKAIIMKAHWNDGLVHLKYKPKVIVTPWAYDDEEINDLCSEWRGGFPNSQVKIVNLHCEQLANSNGASLLIPKRKALGTYHLAWGQYFKDLMINAGVNEKLITITGSPRLDFFKEKYKAANKTKTELADEYNLSLEKKWILLIGNFSAMGISPETAKRTEEKGYKSLKTLIDISSSSYSELMCWFEEACKKIPNDKVEWIYRPHPNEPIKKEVVALEKDFSNFHVIKNLTIKDWIVNSDIAFGWCSTSSVEVVTAGVPIFNLRPIPIPDSMKMPLVDNIETLSDVHSFVTTVDLLLTNKLHDVNSIFKKEISYYYNDSETSATEKTANLIVTISQDNSNLFKTKYNYLAGIKKTIRFGIKSFLLKVGIRTKSVTEIVYNDIMESKKIKNYREKIDRIDI